jgi:hypothetical protein
MHANSRANSKRFGTRRFLFLPASADRRLPLPQTEYGNDRTGVENFAIDLENSWMIGDKAIDVETGFNAGIKTALVLTGYGRKILTNCRKRKPDMWRKIYSKRRKELRITNYELRIKDSSLHS